MPETSPARFDERPMPRRKTRRQRADAKVERAARAAGDVVTHPLTGKPVHKTTGAELKSDNYRVVIVRGPWGSGKSTHAEELVAAAEAKGDKAVSLCTDDYFTDPKTGDYFFDGRYLTDANRWLRENLRHYLEQEYNLIVLDGIHQKKVHYATNKRIAEEAEYAVVVHQMEMDQPGADKLEKAYFDAQTHGVRAETCKRIVDGWEADESATIIPTDWWANPSGSAV